MAKPASSATLNTGHAHAANLISCLPLLEGTGIPADVVRTTTYSTLPAAITWTTSGDAQYVPCLTHSGTSDAPLIDTHTPPLNGRTAPWAILIGVRITNLTRDFPLYWYLEPNSADAGNGPAFIFEFVNNTVEFYHPPGTGEDLRTSSGIVIADNNWHVVGYSHASVGGAYLKWLDGTPTTIDSAFTFTFANTLDRTYLFGRPGDNSLPGEISFVYEWAAVPDMAAISADPWAMFSTTAGALTTSVAESLSVSDTRRQIG